jgi:hypothetical protein
MIEADNLAVMLEKQIRQTVDAHMVMYIHKTIDSLILDRDWIERVEQTINQEFSRRFSDAISTVDFDDLMAKQLDSALDRWRQRLTEDFETRGIKDCAAQTELTVMTGAVVAENDLITQNLQVTQDLDLNGTARIKNLIVSGAINTDHPAWDEIKNVVVEKTLAEIDQQWQQQLVRQVLDLAKTQGIDFDHVRLQGAPLVHGSALNASITETNIKKLGVLRELTVNGPAQLNDTVHVANRRVGVNTEKPEMALGIWDEEVSVIIGKLRSQQAYVGTSRLQNLAIGVNRQPVIEIDTEGMVRIQKLTVDKWRVGFDKSTPGYSGARGDIVFNTDPRPGEPFAWQCLGDYRWQALRTAT